MSRVLPAELQTRKVKSLSDDQRKLVEDLLADKFDIKEEVAPKKAKSFPGRDGWDVNGLNEIFNRPDVDNRWNDRRQPTIQVERTPWNDSRIAKVEVHYPDERSLIDAFRLLDTQTGTRHRRKIFVGRMFFHELMRDHRFGTSFRMMAAMPREGEEREMGEIFGFPVIQIASPRYDNACFVHQEI